MRHAVHIIIPKSIELRLNSIVVTPISRVMNVTKKRLWNSRSLAYRKVQ